MILAENYNLILETSQALNGKEKIAGSGLSESFGPSFEPPTSSATGFAHNI